MTSDGVFAVVVDEFDNVVGVFARHPRPDLHDRLVATYGLDAIRVNLIPDLNAMRGQDR